MGRLLFRFCAQTGAGFLYGALGHFCGGLELLEAIFLVEGRDLVSILGLDPGFLRYH